MTTRRSNSRGAPPSAATLDEPALRSRAAAIAQRVILGAALLACLAAAAPSGTTAPLPDLFNGRDLSGWVVEGTGQYNDGDETRPVWSVKEGILTCAGKGFGFLRYDKEVSDFLFHAEYRLSPKGNSGIGIRTVRYLGSFETRPSMAAYEIQLLDDAGKPPNTHSTGSLYRYVAPTANPVKPAPQWNTIEVECVGPRIRITINGQRVQDVDQTSVSTIKSKPLRGFVCLQNHGKSIEFRNVRLKKLTSSDAPAKPTAGR